MRVPSSVMHLLVLACCSACRSAPLSPEAELPPAARERFVSAMRRIEAVEPLPAGDPVRDEYLERARRQLESVVTDAPRFFPAQRALQDVLLEIDPGHAWQIYNPEPLPGDAPSLTLAARLLMTQDEKQAERLLERAVRREPNFAWARYGLAFLRSRAGKVEEALTLLDSALRTSPDFPEALRLNAELVLRLGRRDEALETYARLLELDPDDDDVRYRRAHLLVQSDDREEARLAEQDLRRIQEHLQAVTGEEAREFLRDVALDLGVALVQQGQPQQALEAFEEALELDPALLQAHYNRAWVLEHQLGRQQEALAAYEKYLDVAAQERDPLPVPFLLDVLFYVPENIRRLREELAGVEERQP